MDIRPLVSKGFDLWSPVECEEPSTSREVELLIWNGTGALDVGTDWSRSGFGEEHKDAKYQGSNGLWVNTVDDSIEDGAVGTIQGGTQGGTQGDTYISTTKELFFSSGYFVDLTKYDFLSLWVSIRKWKKLKEVWVKIFNTTGGSSRELLLGTYLRLDVLKTWQRVRIPLSFFGHNKDTDEVDSSISINKIRFKFHPQIEVWIDEVKFSTGTLLTIPVCNPEPMTHEIGKKAMQVSEEIMPIIKPTVFSDKPTMSVSSTNIQPFPKPIII